ncbi:MAG TPA: hypothetical protein PLO84_12280 [Thermotogota bacterium]|nr:hypothetical protein [Thermotogota bacterium]
MVPESSPSDRLTAHQLMNSIYIKARIFHDYLKAEEVQHTLGFFPGNYLNISGKQCIQEYPIPVCSFEDGGDIGFNLDGIFFEFFLEKSDLLKANLGHFFNSDCRVEVYGAEICTDDFLFVDEGEEPFRNRLIASGERHFGIAFYFDKQMEPEELYKTFIGKGKILGLKG